VTRACQARSFGWEAFPLPNRLSGKHRIVIRSDVAMRISQDEQLAQGLKDIV
jgi:hypothetical protein